MDEIVEMMAEAIAATSGHNEPEAWVNEARAAISALHAGGWRIVPVEPTEEVLIAIEDAGQSEWTGTVMGNSRPIYRALLAASPIKMEG